MAKNNLIYDVDEKPSWSKTIVFALQQLLAIMAATIAVPMIVGNGMSTSAALFGAGVLRSNGNFSTRATSLMEFFVAIVP